MAYSKMPKPGSGARKVLPLAGPHGHGPNSSPVQPSQKSGSPTQRKVVPTMVSKNAKCS